jgi:cyclic pyranopterin monophosphate synthase
MGEFSHLDESGKARMVDIGEKLPTRRIARARAIVFLPDVVAKNFDGNDLQTKKGGVFQTAIIAGIMGAKKTGELIPLCHPLGLDHCSVDLKFINKNELEIIAEAAIESKTGVEMEALMAVSIAALAIYDMCKALSHEIKIKNIELISKSGGKSEYTAT